jgi:Transmembrane domain of unknown function (DUF3566)
MALHERADVLATPDPDAIAAVADTPDEQVRGNGAVGAEDELDATDGPDRAARKRTARQRTLLVTGNGADSGAIAPVDPLLAGSALVEEQEEAQPDVADADDAEPDGESQHPVAAVVDAEELAREELSDQLDVVAAPDVAPELVTEAVALPLTTARIAATTIIPLEPPPTSPIPLPAILPDGDGPAVVADEPAPPVAVPLPPKPQRRARPRVRKVTRVVRSVDAWSVFKIALIFFAAMGVVIVTAGVLLWNLAQSTGTLDNVEGFFREAFNYDTFKLNSGPLFHALLTLTVLFVVAGTGMAVVMAVLFNLIADLTGGIQVTVLEREVVARDDPRNIKRRRATRRPAGSVRGAAPPPPPSVPG